MEPSLFRQIEVELPGRLFRVSRPGRGSCGSRGNVTDHAVQQWVDGIASSLRKIDPTCLSHPLQYVCLLGSKGDGRREISDVYPACGPEDPPGKPTFEEYLNAVANSILSIRVHHVPTVDHQPVPPQAIAKIEPLMRQLLESGATVLLGCSAAMGRTVEVMKAIPWIRSIG